MGSKHELRSKPSFCTVTARAAGRDLLSRRRVNFTDSRVPFQKKVIRPASAFLEGPFRVTGLNRQNLSKFHNLVFEFPAERQVESNFKIALLQRMQNHVGISSYVLN